jgi:starch synthase
MRYPGRVSIQIGYNEPLAHRLLAGADILLHPSRFEPCGLVPMYAMRYGAIPVVRSSGGMADTVVDATRETLKSGTATGFCFEEQNASQLTACTRRALAIYAQPIPWRKLQTSAMRQDFSWDKSAKLYADLYRSLASRTEFERVASIAN